MTVPSASSVTITEISEAVANPAAPPPTPIQVIQHIGTNICAIPAAELTEDELLSDKDVGPSSASA